MSEFLMPKLGTDMKAGTLVAWHKKPGDSVKRGDVIAEVETDKGDIDIEVFTNGVLDKLLVQPGETVPVGTALAVIQEAVAGAEHPTTAAPSAPAGPEAVIPPLSSAARLVISPSARKLARELGVDPTAVKGTGPGAAVTREDIQRAATAKEPKATIPAPQPDRAARMRRAIAAAMARSKREIPHYYLSTAIDMHAAVTWLADRNAKRPVTERLLYGVLLLKAVALALREVPELNAVWENDRAVLKPSIHVGVAISLRQGGLVAPAIHDTDRQSLDELMVKLSDLVQRARAGSLKSSELSEPTITVTNLGEQGIETVFGIIYPPQVAIVGFGKITDSPWSVNGQIVSRPVITATLAADHRVSDGHRGSLFLAAVGRLLQEPDRL